MVNNNSSGILSIILIILAIIFNGNLFKNQKVSSYKIKKISVKIINGGSFAQADGELIHGESFEFKILKNAISFFK